ncbi:MAG: pyridoxamine 5'-phosphate oxidase family protein [Anaerolineae bacterium]
MTSYHLRRTEKEIEDEEELFNIIARNKYLTIAMSKDNAPYLVTLSYGFDGEARCFYFHCANQGRKIDYLQANSAIWGQILEDCGYVDGECNHAFRTVQFRGTVGFVDSLEEKTHAIALMLDQLEPDPEPMKQRLMKPESLRNLTMGKILVHEMTGKRNPETTD